MLSNANDNSEHRAHGGSLKSFIKTAFGPSNQSLEFLRWLLQFVISIVQASLPSETIMLIKKITLCLKVQLRDCTAQKELGNLFSHFEARSQRRPWKGAQGLVLAKGLGRSQGELARTSSVGSEESFVVVLLPGRENSQKEGGNKIELMRDPNLQWGLHLSGATAAVVLRGRIWEWWDKGKRFQTKRGETEVGCEREILNSECGEALALAKEANECPISGDAQGQAGWGPGSLMWWGPPAHCWFLPTQAILGFYKQVIKGSCEIVAMTNLFLIFAWHLEAKK